MSSQLKLCDKFLLYYCQCYFFLDLVFFTTLFSDFEGNMPLTSTFLQLGVIAAFKIFIGYFTNSDPFTPENVGANNSFVIPISNVMQ